MVEIPDTKEKALKQPYFVICLKARCWVLILIPVFRSIIL
ncbi:hypothetical protein B40_1291 [Lactococcus cremoris]|nr:hypothetical protein B40_1291 [Lactococcus cremoris]